MNLICGFDFETTGLSAENDRIIEVGAVIWDWKQRKPVEIYNQLCWQNDGQMPNLSPEITKINGITNEDLINHSIPTRDCMSRLALMMMRSDAIMAHNAPFDVGFLEAEAKRLEMPWPARLVIDSRTDLPLDGVLHKSKALVHLAATHGFLNPFAHRAFSDVLTMFKIASEYDLPKIVQRATSPTVTVVANVSFEEKDKAKSAGFHWDGAAKLWKNKIKECDLKNTNYPFHYIIDRSGTVSA